MRVIQDSDEEFEEDVEAVPLPPTAVDASATQHDRAKDASSGSTESLKRAFVEAHRDQFQSPSVQSGVLLQTQPQSSVSLPEYPSKKRKTSTSVSPHKLPSTGSPRRMSVTYSKGSKTTLGSPPVIVRHNKSEIQGIQNDTALIDNTSWPNEGIMQDYCAQHDPMALFPEPSSTVPNATYTQQRVLETVTAPALLGLESDTDAPSYVPKASVPWSEILNFSPAATAEQSDPSYQVVEPEPTEHAHDISQQMQKIPSQRSRLGSSIRLRSSPSRDELLVSDIDLKETSPLPRGTFSSHEIGLPPTSTRRSQKNQEGSRKSSQKQTNMVSSVPNSEDDLATIELPGEQYIPRPSRSRSLRVDMQESVDYSVRPEKAAKALKRRKTTMAVSTRSAHTIGLLTTPQKIKQICDMGFTPTSTERALTQNSGDVTQTLDWLIDNAMGEDELAQNTPKKKCTSKPTIAIQSTVAKGLSPTTLAAVGKASTVTDTQDTNDLCKTKDSPANLATMDGKDIQSEKVVLADGAQLKSPRVQVVIPSKSPTAKPPQMIDPPNPSNKKARRRKTTLDAPESDTVFESSAILSMTVEKKRPRGRPKKTANSAATAETTAGVLPLKPREVEEQPLEVLQTLDPNAKNLSTNKDEHNNATTATNSEQPPTADALMKSPPSITASRTPEPSTKITSDSPACKGKVSYRVRVFRCGMGVLSQTYMIDFVSLLLSKTGYLLMYYSSYRELC